MRLTVAGAVDPSFGGGDGLTEIAGAEGPTSLELDYSGGLVAATENENCRRGGNQIFRLGADGTPLATFGSGGVLGLKGRYFSAIESSGAILLSETLRRDELLTHALVKLKPDGSLDRRFGESGRAGLAMPRGLDRRLKPVGVDAQGRMILVGSFDPPRPLTRANGMSKPPTHTGRTRSAQSFLLVTRLRADGKVDRSFGNSGRIVTRFKRPRFLAVKGAELDSQGRLVVAVGSVSTGQLPGARLTLVRYLLDG